MADQLGRPADDAANLGDETIEPTDPPDVPDDGSLVDAPDVTDTTANDPIPAEAE